MAGFPSTPSGGHLCQHARHRVPDPPLLPLRSLQPDLTPSGIYKDLFSKGELEMGHRAATDPTDTSSCARKDGDGVFGGAVLVEGVQTFRPKEPSKTADFPHAGGVTSEQ